LALRKKKRKVFKFSVYNFPGGDNILEELRIRQDKILNDDNSPRVQDRPMKQTINSSTHPTVRRLEKAGALAGNVFPHTNKTSDRRAVPIGGSEVVNPFGCVGEGSGSPALSRVFIELFFSRTPIQRTRVPFQLFW
jgi:hypothetical protein